MQKTSIFLFLFFFLFFLISCSSTNPGQDQPVLDAKQEAAAFDKLSGDTEDSFSKLEETKKTEEPKTLPSAPASPAPKEVAPVSSPGKESVNLPQSVPGSTGVSESKDSIESAPNPGKSDTVEKSENKVDPKPAVVENKADPKSETMENKTESVEAAQAPVASSPSPAEEKKDPAEKDKKEGLSPEEEQKRIEEEQRKAEAEKQRAYEQMLAEKKRLEEEQRLAEQRKAEEARQRYLARLKKRVGEYTYDIFVDGSASGQWVVTIQNPEGDTFHVKSDMQIKIVKMWITLYNYTSVCEETWKGERLVSFKSQTNDGGTKMQMDLTADATGVQGKNEKGAVRTQAHPTTTDNCWNLSEIALTASEALVLDTEKGNIKTYPLLRFPDENIQIKGKAIRCQKLQFKGTDKYTWLTPSGIIMRQDDTSDGHPISFVLKSWK